MSDRTMTMQELWSTFISWLPWLFLLLCVLPLALMGIGLYLLVRSVRRVADPNIEQIDKRYQKLRAASPRASDDVLMRKVIQREAMRSGFVGAITGLGGFLTLPIALPLDVLLSLRIQSTMVQFIAVRNGHVAASAAERRLWTYFILTGGRRISQMTTRASINVMLRFMGRWAAKLIPIAGAVIGFVINYSMARAVGKAALMRYAGDKKARPA
jgi:hypothetical protein